MTLQAIRGGLIADLAWVLREYCNKKATDPRDKVYALLSLVNNWHGRLPIVPNYSSTLSEILQTTSLFNLTTTRRLRAMPTNCMINPNLPSWVTDWGKTYLRVEDCELWVYSTSVQFTASLPTTGENVVLHALPNALLMVKASHFDTVSVVRQSMDVWNINGAAEDPGGQVAQKEILEIHSEIHRLCNYSNPEGHETALWKTICGGIGRSDSTAPRRTDGEDRNRFELWYSFLFENHERLSEQELKLAHSFGRIVNKNIQNRRFFFTEKGYVGIGPKTMQLGDEVYVINGAWVPHILRKADATELPDAPVDPETGKRYSMFRTHGNCYVHGIMDGEACEEGGGKKAFPIILC